MSVAAKTIRWELARGRRPGLISQHQTGEPCIGIYPHDPDFVGVRLDYADRLRQAAMPKGWAVWFYDGDNDGVIIAVHKRLHDAKSAGEDKLMALS